jgi:hypothetical protein
MRGLRMLKWLAGVTAVGTLSIGLLGCDPDEPEGAVGVTDSAGVEELEVYWDDASEVWTVEADPEFVIGDGSMGMGGLDLNQVRSAALLHDGTVVVINGGSEEVVWVDPTNEEVRRWGGRGDGPEEFGGSGGPMAGPGLIRLAALESSRIGVIDQGRRAYVEIDVVEGAFYRVELRDQIASGIVGASVWRDGTVYLASAGTGPPEVRGDVRRSRIELVRIPGSSGQAVEPITETLGPEAVATSSYMGVLLLGSGFAFAAGRQGVWVGDTSRPEVSLWESQDGPVRVIRWTTEADREVTPERLDELMGALAGDLREEDREIWRDMTGTIPTAEQLPAFESLLVGPNGDVWIGAFVSGIADRLERPQPAQEWLIVDPASGSATRLTTPEGLRVVQVGESFILGVHRDDVGVETVRMHRVRTGR